jgi:HEAT repeat protein
MRTGTWICLVVVLLTSGMGLAEADRLPALLGELQSADPESVRQAMAQLGESGDMRALPPLLGALQDERADVRQYALEALQRLVQALDEAHLVVKRWLQSLISTLQRGSSDEVITVERSIL